MRNDSNFDAGDKTRDDDTGDMTCDNDKTIEDVACNGVGDFRNRILRRIVLMYRPYLALTCISGHELRIAFVGI
jgi:hypothetical protein